MKILMGDLEPTKGWRNAHRHLKIGYFAQHHVDQLEMDTSSLELASVRFPGFVLKCSGGTAVGVLIVIKTCTDVRLGSVVALTLCCRSKIRREC